MKRILLLGLVLIVASCVTATIERPSNPRIPYIYDLKTGEHWFEFWFEDQDADIAKIILTLSWSARDQSGSSEASWNPGFRGKKEGKYFKELPGAKGKRVDEITIQLEDAAGQKSNLLRAYVGWRR